MIFELYIVFQIVVIGFFIGSYLTKNELFWVITLLLSGFLMFSSYSMQFLVYQYNTTINAYMPVFISQGYPYLMGINLLFFALSIIFGFIDIIDKYGQRV